MGNDTSNFGGIFSKLGKLVFTEDYLQNKDNTEIVTPTAYTATNSTAPTNTIHTPVAKQDMIEKVHTLVKSINKPGIDFFELWNATEAMGAINETNVFNAFVALKIASGNTLTKEVILSTGNSYCSELQLALESDINDKIKIKNKLQETKNNNRSNLSNEITELNNKIVELQNELKNKNLKLQNIDSDFDPKLIEIDEKIADGKAAVQTVISEIKSVIEIANKAIKA